MNLNNVKRIKNFNNEEMILKAKAGCEESKEAVFINNIPLVRKLVNKWRNNGSKEPLDELCSIGYLALTKAYNTFDSSRNIMFSTYLGKVVWREFMMLAAHNSRVFRSKYELVSIDDKVYNGFSDDEATWHESVYDEGVTDEYIAIENELYEWKFELMVRNSGIFNRKERVVVRDYFFRNKSFVDIGLRTKVSKQAVQQMFIRCLKKIKDDGRMIV